MNTNRTFSFFLIILLTKQLHMLKKGKEKPPQPPLEGEIK